MGIRKNLILGFSGITFLTIIIGCTSLIRLYKIADLNKEMPKAISTVNKASRLDGLAQFIRYYDEVLTQSARNYAFTQNKKWERRYRDVEPRLDSIIKEAIEKGGEKDRDFFNSVDKANLALIEMEYKAIELTNNGQAGKAVQILESSEYWEQKKIYEQGLRNYVQEKGFEDDQVHGTFLQKIELLNIKTHNLIQSSTLLVSAFIVVSFAMSVIVGCAIFRSITNPLTKLRNATAEIGKGRLDTEIDISSKDEIGQLADAFNKMTEDLSRTTTSIDILNAAKQQLKAANQQLRTNEEYLKQINHSLGERVKELNCLYGLFQFSERDDIALEDIFQDLAELIPSGWQYPEITAARITFEGHQFKTSNFRKTAWIQTADIKVYGQKAGSIEVCYLKKMLVIDEGPFLKEERSLLNALAERVGSIITRKRAEEALKAANQQLHAEILGRKKLDEKLYRKQKNLEAIFDAAPFGMMLANENLRVDRVNDAIRQIIHKDYLQILNQPIGNILGCFNSSYSEKGCGHSPSCGSCLMMQSVTSVLNSECSIYSLEVQLVLKINNEETSPWFSISIVPTKIDNQKYVLITFNDITKQKKADEALRGANKELEHTNKTLKGVQSQMVQSEKMASIGQLAAGVAHEMNTPVGFVASNFQTLKNYVKKIQNMFVIYGNIIKEVGTSENMDIINKAREDMKLDFILEDIQELFSDSEEGLERVTNIVQNLRDFSRIDQSGDLAEYSINEGIKSTLVVAKNEIKYDCDILTDYSEVPFILCNPGQINQVFLNILVNSAQAIKSQKRDSNGTIKITTYANDDEVTCEITDDGPGIPPEKLTKVFDPFFTTKPAGKGTGLGLSVSYDIIVNKHKGKLIVDSVVGEGAKFTIKLPVKKQKNSDGKETTNYGKEECIIRG